MICNCNGSFSSLSNGKGTKNFNHLKTCPLVSLQEDKKNKVVTKTCKKCNKDYYNKCYEHRTLIGFRYYHKNENLSCRGEGVFEINKLPLDIFKKIFRHLLVCEDKTCDCTIGKMKFLYGLRLICKKWNFIFSNINHLLHIYRPIESGIGFWKVRDINRFLSKISTVPLENSNIGHMYNDEIYEDYEDFFLITYNNFITWKNMEIPDVSNSSASRKITFVNTALNSGDMSLIKNAMDKMDYVESVIAKQFSVEIVLKVLKLAVKGIISVNSAEEIFNHEFISKLSEGVTNYSVEALRAYYGDIYINKTYLEHEKVYNIYGALKEECEKGYFDFYYGMKKEMIEKIDRSLIPLYVLSSNIFLNRKTMIDEMKEIINGMRIANKNLSTSKKSIKKSEKYGLFIKEFKKFIPDATSK